MKPSMSEAWVRNVWKRITSPGPMTLPARFRPTWPATTTISPAGAVMPWEYMPRAGPRCFDVIALVAMARRLSQPDVLEVDGLAVDAARRGGDPVGEFSRLGDRVHQALDVRLVAFVGQPVTMPAVPLGLADHAAVRGHPNLGEEADGAVEGPMGQRELHVDTVLPDDLVP